MIARPVPRRELDFLLYELLGVERLCERARYAEHARETFAAALDTAYAIAEERFAPHYRSADEHEPQVIEGRVRHARGMREALRAFSDAGFIAAAQDSALGGMQLPFVVAVACWSVFKSVNIATETYATLTIGAANLIRSHGTPEQIARWLPPMLEGRFFGTMVLTEPQAGSSLADVQASATPRPDGTYALRGQKIFITAGEHDLSENIVHLVLARLPDAPPGVKGLSLFIVPKLRADGEPNDVALAGLIHKMGFKGTTSAMLAFGEHGECIGELLGAPHAGLACMFQMMNEARINVGISAAVLACAGYQHSLAYARERLQGRHNGHGKPVPIIEHADVRRMLLAQKAIAEGGLALALYAAWLSDEHTTSDDADVRARAGVLLELLTPVIKAWCSQHALTANEHAIQIHGGYGYTRDYPVEQIYRDNRLNPIHEGTNGIQALDLLGRKLNGGAGFAALEAELQATLGAAREAGAEAAELAGALDAAWLELRITTETLQSALRSDAPRTLAVASAYLDVFGHTVIAWMWLRQLLAAHGDDAFCRGKRAAASWFFRWELPKATAQHAALREREPTAYQTHDEWFGP